MDEKIPISPLSRWGILILNLGTPRSPDVADVRRYLTEFLMDPFVIDLPTPLRFLFVHGLISPLRAPRSARLYEKIWTPEGSPLAVETARLAAAMGDRFPTAVAYRYGEDHIAGALQRLKKQQVDRLLVFPLYPQYAESSTLTMFEALKEALKKNPFRGVRLIQDYHREDFYLESLVDSVRHHSVLFQRGQRPDAVVFSYHGLPVRHITKASERCRECVQQKSCSSLHFNLCYRGQCYVTSRLLEGRLAPLFSENPRPVFYTGFQSRLGRTPWIQPVTEEIVLQLARTGKKNILVMAPGFAVDCLETLEELDLGLRKKFIESGGETFDRVPCLNGDGFWSERLRNRLHGQIDEQLQLEQEELEYAQNQRTPTSQSTH